MAERPRDRLGRPLPVGAVPDPSVPRVPAIDGLDDAAVWTLATDLLDSGLPFHAHEVFEARWRTAEADERDAWRACAQWGAALTHEARGNEVGAAQLAARALATLQEARAVPTSIDAARVRRSCAELAGG